MSSGRRFSARVALALGSLVISLLVAELVYRQVAPVEGWEAADDEWTRRYRHMNETIYMRSDVDGLVYEPRPESRVEMEYGWAGFDDVRRRWDGERHVPWDADVRVALIGDSLAWSEFVAYDDSLAVQTEAALGDRFRVSSFGVSGYDVTEQARYYPARVAPLEPDVVVLVFCLNDLFLASGPHGRFATDEERARKDEQDRWFDEVARVRRETLDGVAMAEEAEAPSLMLARLRSYWRRATFEDHYVDEYLIAARDDAHVTRAREALAALGESIGDAPALLVISPLLESWDDYHWGEIHDLVREAGEAAGFTVVDPLERWRETERPEDLRAPGDHVHYDERGNRVFGQVIADAVEAAVVD